MNEFESDWISLNQSFVLNGWMQDRRIHDGWHHQSCVRLNEWSFFVQNGSLEESRIQDGWESSSWVRMNESESDWISLSQSFVQSVWIQDGSVWIQHGRIQDGCHHQVESEWMSEAFLCKMAESKMVEFKMAAIITLSENEWVTFFFVQNGWLEEGTIQDGWYHQVKCQWIRLN